MSRPAFKFIDLFSGIGGFHAALSGLGGQCVYASEIDSTAAKVYEANWGVSPLGDITLQANDTTMNVPKHDVLAAGFPCQPFSQVGQKKGFKDNKSGNLFFAIEDILKIKRPLGYILENVQHLRNQILLSFKSIYTSATKSIYPKSPVNLKLLKALVKNGFVWFTL